MRKTAKSPKGKEQEIIINYEKYPFLNSVLDERILKNILLEMLKIIQENGYSTGDFISTFVTDSEIAELNSKFLNCAGPTNVLSFSGQPDFFGTLYISMDTVRRESFLYGQEEERHLIRLLAHGMSHLAGFEHGPEQEVLQALCERKACQLLNLEE